MPTGTEGRATRRVLLAAMASVVAMPAVALERAAREATTGDAPRRAAAATALRLAAAWDDDQGLHHVGVLAWDGRVDSPLVVQAAIEVPTRAHAVLPRAGGEIVAVARRPGAWMLRWRPGASPGRAHWHWSEPDRSFNGHVIDDGDGRLLTTETDGADGGSRLVRRDARTLAVLEEFPTQGIDAHAVLALPGGGWIVANGGVPTRPESGRQKIALETMDSSLVRLDARGRLLGQWRLPDRRLSLRHLARRADGLLGIALQAEHDEIEARRAAPLLALWDGRSLRTAAPTTNVSTPEGSPEGAPEASLEGYAGDIVALPDGFVLGATRAGCVVHYGIDGRPRARHALPEACPLAVQAGRWLAGGRGLMLSGEGGDTRAVAPPRGLRLDNHWQAMPA